MLDATLFIALAAMGLSFLFIQSLSSTADSEFLAENEDLNEKAIRSLEILAQSAPGNLEIKTIQPHAVTRMDYALADWVHSSIGFLDKAIDEIGEWKKQIEISKGLGGKTDEYMQLLDSRIDSLVEAIGGAIGMIDDVTGMLSSAEDEKSTSCDVGDTLVDFFSSYEDLPDDCAGSLDTVFLGKIKSGLLDAALDIGEIKDEIEGFLEYSKTTYYSSVLAYLDELICALSSVRDTAKHYLAYLDMGLDMDSSFLDLMPVTARVDGLTMQQLIGHSLFVRDDLAVTSEERAILAAAGLLVFRKDTDITEPPGGEENPYIGEIEILGIDEEDPRWTSDTFSKRLDGLLTVRVFDPGFVSGRDMYGARHSWYPHCGKGRPSDYRSYRVDIYLVSGGGISERIGLLTGFDCSASPQPDPDLECTYVEEETPLECFMGYGDSLSVEVSAADLEGAKVKIVPRGRGERPLKLPAAELVHVEVRYVADPEDDSDPYDSLVPLEEDVEIFPSAPLLKTGQRKAESPHDGFTHEVEVYLTETKRLAVALKFYGEGVGGVKRKTAYFESMDYILDTPAYIDSPHKRTYNGSHVEGVVTEDGVTISTATRTEDVLLSQDITANVTITATNLSRPMDSQVSFLFDGERFGPETYVFDVVHTRIERDANYTQNMTAPPAPELTPEALGLGAILLGRGSLEGVTEAAIKDRLDELLRKNGYSYYFEATASCGTRISVGYDSPSDKRGLARSMFIMPDGRRGEMRLMIWRR